MRWIKIIYYFSKTVNLAFKVKNRTVNLAFRFVIKDNFDNHNRHQKYLKKIGPCERTSLQVLKDCNLIKTATHYFILWTLLKQKQIKNYGLMSSNWVTVLNKEEWNVELIQI